MVATQPHVLKGIASFRATILGGKSFSFFSRFWTVWQTKYDLNAAFTYLLKVQPPSNIKNTFFLHRSSPMLAQLCPLTFSKIKGDAGAVGVEPQR